MMRFDKYWLHAKQCPIPKGYGFAYCEYDRAVEVYYPLPLNYIIRYARKVYWKFLRAFHWLGLIDVAAGEVFTWNDFYRIKTH